MVNVKNICKSYGKKQVLKDVTFTVEDGLTAGIIGVNGTGKSTLLSIMAGIKRPNCGTVTYSFNGATFSPKKDKDHMIGYIPQNNPLIEDLSVMDNLKLWYCNSRLNLQDELDHGILKMLGVHEFVHMKTSTLSGGMKKRLSIGIAMAENPPLLLLDEPGAALDILCREDIRNYLSSYKKKGGTIIIATHDEEELSLCDKLFVIKDCILSEIPAHTSGDALYNCLRTV